MANKQEKLVPLEEVAPAEIVTQLMRQRISQYLAARSEPSLYQSVRNMSQFVSDDYGNRFLVELIQNAHDAHDPSRTDGEIAVVLDLSKGGGDHGCLYIANRGEGFIGNNLKAITNIALSSKPVNAGIGNKGIGFRSVLQVCDWPEIYSVQGAGGSGVFNGYCFRFATVEDLRNQLSDEPEEAVQEMARNLPCWHVPVPLEPGANVATFAIDGFATVVRLPLKSADALDAVRAQIDVLLGLKTPLHLFLDRVGRISLDNGTGQPILLERKVTETWTVAPPGFKANSPVQIEKILLGTEEFIVAHWNVDDNLFRDALQSSLEKNEVPANWRDWEGAARVSVAVPLMAALDVGRLYCFLPLGEEGKAPFAGYINANFYTKMDRRKVDASIRLNALFMRMSAWLSCQLIGFLVKSDLPHVASAVVSLLCWDDAYLETLKHAMGDNGKGILIREFLPVRGPDDTIRWASANDTYAWSSPPDASMSPKLICEVGGGSLLTEILTLNQRAALDRLYVQLRGADFKPPAEVVANWVERIAGQMHEDSAAPERWATFYDEVALALANKPSHLFGKRFLLSANGELISSELPAAGSTGRIRRAADVYFAPALTGDAAVDDENSKQPLPLERLPTTLRKGFAMLNAEVPWLKEDGGHRPGHSFLIAGKLAREYDTGDILRTLARVTNSSGADRTREQALDWAFRLWSSGRSLSDKETRLANFFVPTSEGWIDAKAAMFGAGWDVPNGKRLHALLLIAAGDSEDMMHSLARLLPEHAAWPIRHGKQTDWVRFLFAAGVSDCLRPIGGEKISSERIGYPGHLPIAISQYVTGLPEALRTQWRELLTQDCTRMYSSRQYRAELQSWRIPGQNEHQTFSPEVRRDFAIQVALAIRALGDEHRTFRAVRADAGAAPELHRLSTPLIAFLTGGEWVPVMRQGGHLRFVKPKDAWYINTDEERPPRFMEFVVRQVATAIDPPTLEWLQDRAKLGLFNDKRHAGRALLTLVEGTPTKISDIRDVRRFRELFQRLWVVARQESTLKSGSRVPVVVDGVINIVTRTGDEFHSAYFDDESDSLKKQLLEEVGEPVFDFIQGDKAAAWNWVNSSVPGKFRHISDEPAEVYVDGRKFDEGAPSRLLTDIFGSWIIDFLVCVAEHKSSAFVQTTQNTLGKIRRNAMGLTVVTGQQIEIAHGEKRVALPASLHGALVLHRLDTPVLIIQSAEGELTIELLAGAAGQLAVALGLRELVHGLDAALLRLAAAMRDQDGNALDDSTVAEALGVELEAIRQTRRLASGDLIGTLYLAIPLSACIGTLEITSRLQELDAEDAPHDEDLRSTLEDLATVTGMKLLELEERMMYLVDLADLKAEFSLTIAKLNAAISTLGGKYKQLSNEHVHREAWTRHLRQSLAITTEKIRERTAATFDRKEPLIAYTSARDDALNFAPDRAWFIEYDDLPEAVMNGHIYRWINERLPADAAIMPLELTLNECRAKNGTRLRDFLATFSPVLSAWVRVPDASTTAEVRQTWNSPETAREVCIARARDSGWLDFRELDEDQIANWLTLDGVWPVGRSANSDPAAWNLTKDNLTSSEERAKLERVEQLCRRTEVEFSGVTMSALSNGYMDIAAAVAAAADKAPALYSASANDATLESMDPAKPSGSLGGGSTRGVPKLPESGMSDDQKMAVGLIGELWAREWLQRRHHLESVDESVWVSCYRDKVLNTSGGSDKLGYDFVVATKSRTFYYEVKASTGDPLRFEMGPTEIFAAQRYRADGDNRYRILYLSNVGNPKQMSAMLLANPFSAKGVAKFRSIGRGSVTYEFDPIR